MNGLSMKAKSKQDRRDFDNGGYDYQQQTIHNQDNYNGGDYSDFFSIVSFAQTT